MVITTVQAVPDTPRRPWLLNFRISGNDIHQLVGHHDDFTHGFGANEPLDPLVGQCSLL